MRFGTVCSGIGAPEQAWQELGWECVFASEIEKFPSAVHQIRFPGVPNLGDMTKFKEWNDYAIDLICGGTPCQSFSVAGLRKGLDDPRGNLMLTFGAITARYKPRWIVFENVPGLLSSGDGGDFGSFLGMLVLLGYGFAYRVFDAQYFGLAQRRKRVFVVGHFGGQWQRAAAVLFDRASVCGNSAPRRETREGITGTLSARTKGGGGLGTDFDLGGGLTTTPEVCGERAAHSPRHGHAMTTQQAAESGQLVPEIARAVAAKRDGYNDGSDQTYIPEVAWALQERDAKGVAIDTKDGHLIVTPILEAGARQGEKADLRDGLGVGEPGDPMFTLQAGKQHAIAFDTTQVSSVANYSNPKPGDACHPLAAGAHPPAIAFSCKDSGNDAGPLAPTLRSGNHDGSHANGGVMPAVSDGMRVRRLTPRECERLQGFPDNFTMIPWNSRAAEDCPDGPRYRTLGNSMAVPVMRWIGERIKLLETILPFDKPTSPS